jgi:hypothetical protein
MASREVAGYSGTPLPKKLGIKPDGRVLLIDAPALPALDPLPAGVTVDTSAVDGRYDVIVLFCPDTAHLLLGFAPLVDSLTTAGALWACWPKKSSGVATDLTDHEVRAHGLDCGLVDVKVAAIDLVWSGLKFVRRLTDR